jgi:glycosyltransferase involved in cell wall biosynthesis
MRWLIGSDLEPNINSGAAGTIQRHAETLEALGESVDVFWRKTVSFETGPSLRRVLELPWIQSEQILSAMRREQYDVVLTSQPHVAMAYRLLSKLHPGTLRLNRTHGWEARYAENERYWARFEPRASLARSSIHSLTDEIVKRQGRDILRTSHGLIVPSSKCALHMAKEVPSARSKILCVPWGVDGDWRDLPKKEGPLGVAFVAQFVPRKGFNLLPEICRRLDSSVRLTVVTNDAGLPWVEQELRPILGDRLALSAWVPRAQLMELIAEQDALLTLSFFEGFCKVFVEAMASGLCVVGFDEGGLSDIAKHGESALLTALNDTDAVVGCLNDLARGPERARALGRRAREVSRSLTWKACAEKTLEFARERRSELRRMHEARK